MFFFCGFTPIAWDMSDEIKSDFTLSSFVLVLTDRDFINERRYEPRRRRRHFSDESYCITDFPGIKCDSSTGPHFYDLIANNSSRFHHNALHIGAFYGKDTIADDFPRGYAYPRNHTFDISEIQVFEDTDLLPTSSYLPGPLHPKSSQIFLLF
jgi:hypothetical protein